MKRGAILATIGVTAATVLFVIAGAARAREVADQTDRTLLRVG